MKKKGQWVRYTYNGHNRFVGRTGRVTHSYRVLTYVEFGDGNYGCYDDFLVSLNKRERAIAMAEQALGVSNDQT